MPSVDSTEALRKLTGHFIDCYRNGRRPLTGGREGLDVVVALEASEMSLANGGRAVSVENDELILG